MLPYYKDLNPKKAKLHDKSHPGLFFDKFPRHWNADWHKPLDKDAKRNFFRELVKESVFTKTEISNDSYLERKLKSYLERQESLVRHLNKNSEDPFLSVKTNWRYVSGLGATHPYETGFIWHKTLGVPYLPGSSIKGLMRAWVEEWCNFTPNKKMDILRLFGYGGSDETSYDEAGTLIVFDALPARVPKLEIDIINPHYQPYYDDKRKPPADYYNPVPVFFLTVAPGQQFRFALAPRPGAMNGKPVDDVNTGLELLKEALGTIGAGGKTSTGYGIFEMNDSIDTKMRKEIASKKLDNLILEFSKNLNNTKKKLGKDFERYGELVIELRGDEIKSLRNSNKKNDKKAYKNLFFKKES